MTMRKLFLLFNLSLAVCTLRAQNQWVNWNSSNGGISFKSGSAQLFTGVPKNLQYPDYTGQRSFSYADPQTGALLFLPTDKISGIKITGQYFSLPATPFGPVTVIIIKYRLYLSLMTPIDFIFSHVFGEGHSF